jgi:hypothetical protein
MSEAILKHGFENQKQPDEEIVDDGWLQVELRLSLKTAIETKLI